MDQEEIFWRQKSRDQWILDGNCNTRYYHTETIVICRKNRVIKLRDDNGSWIDDATNIQAHAIKYFKQLYHEENRYPNSLPIKHSYPSTGDDSLNNLNNNPFEVEIRRALFNIGSYKAPKMMVILTSFLSLIRICLASPFVIILGRFSKTHALFAKLIRPL